MTLENESANGIHGYGEDVSGLRSEVSRLKELLQIKTGELDVANSKLNDKEKELIALQDDLLAKEVEVSGKVAMNGGKEGGEGREREEEVERLKSEVDSLRQQLEASQKEVHSLKKELTDREVASAEVEGEFRRVNRDILAAANENRQLRQRVDELNKEKREYIEKSKSMDAKVMHAAAEAELTRMGHRPPSEGWSTTSVALISIAAAVGGGVFVAYLKRSSR